MISFFFEIEKNRKTHHFRHCDDQHNTRGYERMDKFARRTSQTLRIDKLYAGIASPLLVKGPRTVDSTVDGKQPQIVFKSCPQSPGRRPLRSDSLSAMARISQFVRRIGVLGGADLWRSRLHQGPAA